MSYHFYTSPEFDRLYSTIACLTNILEKSKLKVKLLQTNEGYKKSLVKEEKSLLKL